MYCPNMSCGNGEKLGHFFYTNKLLVYDPLKLREERFCEYNDKIQMDGYLNYMLYINDSYTL